MVCDQPSKPETMNQVRGVSKIRISLVMGIQQITKNTLVAVDNIYIHIPVVYNGNDDLVLFNCLKCEHSSLR